ncbi:bifunctional DNA primase/polymerase [Streptomyces sp. NPDC001774]
MSLEAATRAVAKGFHIFPCNPPGTVCPETGDNIEKLSHLITPNKRYKMRWPEAATTDMARVAAWWAYSPNANIGIACKPSGLLVVDCDMPKRPNQLADTPWGYLHDQLGPLVDGSDVLREMCRRYGDSYERLEQTYRVCTGSLGLHLYYRWPDEIQASQASPVPGLLDVRCNANGYVLAAGSVTYKGPYVAENDLPVADAPGWLVELCRKKPPPDRPAPSRFQQPGGGHSGLIKSIRYAAEGQRHFVLYWAACRMSDEGIPVDDALTLLTPPALESGLPAAEAEHHIRSAYRRTSR